MYKYTGDSASRYLKLARHTMAKAAKQGYVPFERQGKAYVFEKWVLDVLKSRVEEYKRNAPPGRKRFPMMGVLAGVDWKAARLAYNGAAAATTKGDAPKSVRERLGKQAVTVHLPREKAKRLVGWTQELRCTVDELIEAAVDDLLKQS